MSLLCIDSSNRKPSVNQDTNCQTNTSNVLRFHFHDDCEFSGFVLYALNSCIYSSLFLRYKKITNNIHQAKQSQIFSLYFRALCCCGKRREDDRQCASTFVYLHFYIYTIKTLQFLCNVFFFSDLVFVFVKRCSCILCYCALIFYHSQPHYGNSGRHITRYYYR